MYFWFSNPPDNPSSFFQRRRFILSPPPPFPTHSTWPAREPSADRVRLSKTSQHGRNFLPRIAQIVDIDYLEKTRLKKIERNGKLFFNVFSFYNLMCNDCNSHFHRFFSIRNKFRMEHYFLLDLWCGDFLVFLLRFNCHFLDFGLELVLFLFETESSLLIFENWNFWKFYTWKNVKIPAENFFLRIFYLFGEKIIEI